MCHILIHRLQIIIRLHIALAMLIVSLSTSATADGVDFKNDLIPVLTKSGCNAGACHGAAVGRGGFKLSLYGGNSSADFDAIVRQLQGRRVNLVNPDQSLVVLKPTQGIEHDGGLIFDEDSDAAKLVMKWIAQGAKNQSKRELIRLTISPQQHVAKEPGESLNLQSRAHYSDGTSRDVTRWTVFTAEDSSAVQIDSQTAVASMLRRGRHIVVARYLNQVIPIELIVPLTDTSVDLSNQPTHNFIDKQIVRSLSTLRLPVSPLINKAAYLRRAMLDLTGRLPKPDAIAAVLDNADDRYEPEFADKLVDELLSSEEFIQYWTLKLAQIFRMKAPQGDGGDAIGAYHSWLADQLRSEVGYDELARTMILAAGDTTKIGPANFYRTVRGPREQAELMSELFMGSRLRCANCHNHPLDRWTQDDYHGLAAIFAKVDSGVVIKEKPTGEVIHPQTLEPATQRIPGEYFLADGSLNGRKQLAEWLTQPKNPYFAKAIVNRLWKSLMGRGLVEPVDDFRATNPATHPELLSQLADDFIKNGYNLRRTLRLIATSATYARSSNALPENKDDDRYYSHATSRPLGPEVLADAISDVLGVPEKYGNTSTGTRAVALVNPKTPSQTLDVLGRCDRTESCEDTSAAVGGLPQKLHLFNGPLLNARIAIPGSRLDNLLVAGKTANEIIDDMYKVALARRPSDEERKHWNRLIHDAKKDDDDEAFLQDFVWAMMTSREFGTNH